MKTLIMICAAASTLASPVAAQASQPDTRDGLRHLTPKAEGSRTPMANLIQSRAIEMGFYSWPIPTEKVSADQANRPRQVSSCSGHDVDYVPAHELGGVSDWQLANTKSAKAFIYEWMAYNNAIKAKDCTCDTLKADWPAAVSAFDSLVKGVEDFRIYTKVPGRMRDQIKHDYDRMCDINMLLEVE